MGGAPSPHLSTYIAAEGMLTQTCALQDTADTRSLIIEVPEALGWHNALGEDPRYIYLDIRVGNFLQDT